MSDPKIRRSPSPPDPGWSAALPSRLPRPTSSPALCAAGVVLLAWAVIASPMLAVFGGALFVVSLVIWIRELMHERCTEEPPRS